MEYVLSPNSHKPLAPRGPFVLFCRILLILGASLFLSRIGVCDRIILKDGSVEESDKVWESGGYVHFILKGTRNVEIRYDREIVERIENENLNPVKNPDRHGPGRPHAAGISKPIDKTTSAVDTQRPGIAAPDLKRLNQTGRVYKIARESKGISFYDPRRPMRYWAYSGSGHDKLQAALLSLAELYHRSTQWVTAHMGEENDLGVIHANLAKQLGDENDISEDQDSVVLSKDSNDALTHKDTKESTVGIEDRPPEGIPSAGISARVAVKPGIRFYDPRRAEKYWTGQMTRHNTLQEAIRALARQYGVSPDWIEDHLGETNALSDIHRNIRQGLNSPQSIEEKMPSSRRQD